MKLQTIAFTVGISLLAFSCTKTQQAPDKVGGSTDSVWLSAGRTNTVSQHEVAVNSALALFASDGNGNFTKFTTMGGTMPFETAAALATLGIELSKGIRRADIVDKYVEVVKQIVSNASTKHHLRPSGALICREQYGGFVGIALGWRQPDIRQKFSAEEQARIVTLMKAGLISNAFVMATYTSTGTKRGNRVVDIEGDPDVYQSPNYSEGYVGVFFAAMAVIGKDDIFSFLNSYSHSQFVTELRAAKFNSTVGKFNATFNLTIAGVTYDASDTLKKATLVENYVRYIDNNDNAGKPFYNNLKLSDITGDPVKLTYYLTTDCYDNVANEGEFAGQSGMAQELDGSDASGTRNSLWYSAAGMINNTYSRYLSEDYGYWAASPEAASKTQIDNLMRVGWSDIASKSWNGYWSRKNGSEAYDRMVSPKSGQSWWQKSYDLARSMGRVKEYYMSDGFDDANYTAYPVWTAASGTWGFAAPPTFTGITTKQDSVISTSVTELRSRLVSEFAADDFEMTVQFKITAFGTSDPEIGMIARYVDANNFYIVKFNKVSSNCEIIEVKNNVWTTLATSTTNFSLTPNTLYFFKVSLIGNQIKFYINNNLKVSATNSSFDYGNVGLFAKYTAAYFDDVFVTKPVFE